MIFQSISMLLAQLETFDDFISERIFQKCGLIIYPTIEIVHMEMKFCNACMSHLLLVFLLMSVMLSVTSTWDSWWLKCIIQVRINFRTIFWSIYREIKFWHFGWGIFLPGRLVSFLIDWLRRGVHRLTWLCKCTARWLIVWFKLFRRLNLSNFIIWIKFYSIAFFFQIFPIFYHFFPLFSNFIDFFHLDFNWKYQQYYSNWED